MNTVLGMVQDHHVAEDLTQEVFVTVYKSLISFNEKSSLSTWIYRITVNKCIDHLRSKNVKKRSGFLSAIFMKDSGETAVEATDFNHPGVQIENREKSKYLFKALNTLPENQKTVFILTYMEDLPQKEVAEIMDMTVKGVESLLQRAKGNLRKYLSDLDI